MNEQTRAWAFFEIDAFFLALDIKAFFFDAGRVFQQVAGAFGDTCQANFNQTPPKFSDKFFPSILLIWFFFQGAWKSPFQTWPLFPRFSPGRYRYLGGGQALGCHLRLPFSFFSPKKISISLEKNTSQIENDEAHILEQKQFSSKRINRDMSLVPNPGILVLAQASLGWAAVPPAVTCGHSPGDPAILWAQGSKSYGLLTMTDYHWLSYILFLMPKSVVAFWVQIRPKRARMGSNLSGNDNCCALVGDPCVRPQDTGVSDSKISQPPTNVKILLDMCKHVGTHNLTFLRFFKLVII